MLPIGIASLKRLKGGPLPEKVCTLTTALVGQQKHVMVEAFMGLAEKTGPQYIAESQNREALQLQAQDRSSHTPVFGTVNWCSGCK